jgi:hypothetical protein
MTSTVFVYTLNVLNAPGKWSRYLFPFSIDAYAQLNDTLYIRSGNDVLKFDASTNYDYNADTNVPSRQVPFDGLVQWGWLDDGTPGAEKEFDGMDITGQGTPTVSFGYDQTNVNLFTEDYTVPPDSIPGALIPIPIMCPSTSVRIKYLGPQSWKLQSVNLWVNDDGGRP